MMFIFLFSRRVAARFKVKVIRKSNVGKIPTQHRRVAIEGRDELPAVSNTKCIGKLENPPYIHQRSAQDLLTFRE